MFRALVLMLFLAACSSQPQTPLFGADDEAPRRVAETAPAAVPLSCNADTSRFCPPSGCTPNSPGQQRPEAIAITTPPSGLNVGQFCSGPDCRNAYFRNLRDRDGELSAEIWTGEGWSRPEGAFELSASRSSFRLSKPASDGILTWRGVCQAAGS
jgi:hypothetical protein